MKLLPLSILTLVLIGSAFSQPQEKKIFKFKKGEPFKWEMKNDLNLSEEQEKKFDDLELQFEKKMIDLRADLERAKLNKRELVNKAKFDKNDYLAAEERIMQAENKIQMEKAKLKMDKYSLLDDNQKEIFMDEGENEFMFKFNMDELKDGMKILKEKLHHLPKSFNFNDEDFEKEIEVEIDNEEI
jgi:hypothetical protein